MKETVVVPEGEGGKGRDVPNSICYVRKRKGGGEGCGVCCGGSGRGKRREGKGREEKREEGKMESYLSLPFSLRGI